MPLPDPSAALASGTSWLSRAGTTDKSGRCTYLLRNLEEKEREASESRVRGGGEGQVGGHLESEEAKLRDYSGTSPKPSQLRESGVTSTGPHLPLSVLSQVHLPRGSGVRERVFYS